MPQCLQQTSHFNILYSILYLKVIMKILFENVVFKSKVNPTVIDFISQSMINTPFGSYTGVI